MLIVNVRDTDSIDKALKQYKRKVNKVGMLKELRRRKHFVKPSVQRRTTMLKAIYRERKYGEAL